MLTTVYLTYLHSDLQIYQMLNQVDPTAQAELFAIAAEMMATTLQQCASQDWTYARRDLAYQVSKRCL
jgi:hypothetical protein